MFETLKIIRAEHRRLAAVINCFTGVLKDIKDRDVDPNFEFLGAVLFYFESFLYQFHHPKEDQYLFPKLRERSEQMGDVLDRLEQEHAEGAGLLKQLHEALDLYRCLPDTGFDLFFKRAIAYRDFEWRHMNTEEAEVLPKASKILSQADRDELDVVFTDHDDPLFGDKPTDEFSVLMSFIVNQAPAPHGLG